MKILITGGTGFIGSYVVSAAINSGHEVCVLRRPDKVLRRDLPDDPVYLTKRLDEVSAKDLSGFDVVIHLAATGVSPQKASVSELIYWNIDATMHLLQRVREANVRRVVIAGTCAEYGSSADRYSFIPWFAPLLPCSSYAASKAAAFLASRAYAIESKLEYVYLRVFSAYGVGQYPKNFYPALRAAAISGEDFEMTLGEQIRDFVPVEKVAKDFLWAACMISLNAGEPLIRNIASGNPTSLKEFARSHWSQLGAKGKLKLGALPYRENEVMRLVPKLEKPFL